MSIENEKHSFWEFRKYKEDEWYKWLTRTLIAVILAYLLSHLLFDFIWDQKMNYEYAKLDAVQMQQINRIYLDSVSTKALIKAKDSLNVHNIPVQCMDSVTRLARSPTDLTIHDKALRYIGSELNNKTDLCQMARIKDFLVLCSPLEASTYLQHVRFKVNSNFWLIGPAVYWEIVFWSWFGVLSSILFNMGMLVKNSTTDPSNSHTVFDSSEIPHQIAKLLYAPLLSLITIFGYNYFADENIVDISSSKGVIVFAFIGGFYSARLVAFLDRLKEVVLPSSGTSTLQTAVQSPTHLEDVKIDLKIEDPSITSEQLLEIAEIGLGSASVIFENEQTAEKIVAEKIGEDQSGSFVIKKIQLGKYIIKATWVNEVLEDPINLTGVQKVDLANVTQPIVVKMTKSETSG